MTAATSSQLSELPRAVRAPTFLTRVRLRAQRYISWLDHQWASAPGGLGISISPHEVQRILAATGDELAFCEASADARALSSAIHEADAAFAADPFAQRMRQELDLSDVELDLLTLAAAVEADPWLRRAFGYIHDDAAGGLPTPWLARQLFRWPTGVQIGPESKLIAWKLARPIEPTNPWSVTAPWVVDPTIASAMIRDGALDVGLDAVRFAAQDAPELCLYPDERDTIVAFVRALAKPGAIEVVLAGPTGAGKRTLAAAICAQLECSLLVVDGPALVAAHPDAAQLRDALVRIVRCARLANAAVYWHELDSVDAPAPALALFGTSRAVTHAVDGGVVRRSVRLPALTRAARAALWSTLSGHETPAPVLDWPLLPSDLVRAAMMAPAGPDAVVEACRSTMRLDAGSLAAPLVRPYTWDDLVVSASVKRHLGELETQARLRWSVYEDWGFGKFFPMGRGIAALFAGPSGTGKTMAAQVLARSLGMELYRVDLAGIMSKYIGETEKNLRQVFDTCERANVLLFFDEADALFGQRMQVKDAHDRFANIEIDYLLQRMEQFDGIAVLATNRKNEIDQAFLRRVRFIIDFMPPGIAERRELWKRALPSRSPTGEELLSGIDPQALAERLDMTGADIKNAATSAAFLARAENSLIKPRHVFRAARRELAKRGIVLREEAE